jgi:hypothetical protein
MERANSFERIAGNAAVPKQPAAKSPDRGEDAVDRGRAHGLLPHPVDPSNQMGIGTSLQRQSLPSKEESEAQEVSSLGKEALGLVRHLG